MMLERSFPSVAQSDILFLFGSMPLSLLPLTIAEIHLYTYLANLIALNKGFSINDWGYRFAVTKDGFPFSESLRLAFYNLVDRSILIQGNRGVYFPSDQFFKTEYDLVTSLKMSNQRRDCVETAAHCVLNLPAGTVRSAINESPGVLMAIRNRQVTTLLKETDLSLIYAEFDEVKKIISGNVDDLLQPAVLWLSARVLNNP